MQTIVKFRSGSYQAQGGRPYQEDELGEHLGDDYRLLVVADGMGGHVGGAKASSIIVSSILSQYANMHGSVTSRLRECMDHANIALQEAIKQDSGLAGMGSTLIVVAISSQGMQWLSVGDSPMWLHRKGKIRRINADHSMAATLDKLVTKGLMTQEEALSDSRRHMLTSAVTGEPITLFNISSEPLPLQLGDRLVLATDGILTLSEAEIEHAITYGAELSDMQLAEDLVGLVLSKKKEYQDNTSVIVCSRLDERHELKRFTDMQCDLMSVVNKKRTILIISLVALLFLTAVLFHITNDEDNSKKCDDSSQGTTCQSDTKISKTDNKDTQNNTNNVTSRDSDNN